MKRIYIAGPYTKGDVAQNVRNAIEAGHMVIEAGFVPYIPHLSHFHHMLYPEDYETWIAIDFIWVDVCDAVIRLPGESSGADREVDLAKRQGKWIFYGVDDFLASIGDEEKYFKHKIGVTSACPEPTPNP